MDYQGFLCEVADAMGKYKYAQVVEIIKKDTAVKHALNNLCYKADAYICGRDSNGKGKFLVFKNPSDFNSYAQRLESMQDQNWSYRDGLMIINKTYHTQMTKVPYDEYMVEVLTKAFRIPSENKPAKEPFVGWVQSSDHTTTKAQQLIAFHVGIKWLSGKTELYTTYINIGCNLKWENGLTRDWFVSTNGPPMPMYDWCKGILGDKAVIDKDGTIHVHTSHEDKVYDIHVTKDSVVTMDLAFDREEYLNLYKDYAEDMISKQIRAGRVATGQSLSIYVSPEQVDDYCNKITDYYNQISGATKKDEKKVNIGVDTEVKVVIDYKSKGKKPKIKIEKEVQI